MKRVVLNLIAVLTLVALAVAMTPAAAKADVIDFALNAGGSWSWNSGSGVFSATGNIVTITVQDLTNSSSTTFTGRITFATGAASGGAGTATNPYTFAGNASSNALVVSTDPAGGTQHGIAAGSTLFSGSLSGATVTNGSGIGAVINFVIGTVNATLLTNLGATGPNSYNGTSASTIIGTASSGASGTLGSTDVTVQNVPEPGSLVLFGTGVLSLAGLLRRKLRA